MDTPKVYRSRPAEIEAIQWTGHNLQSVEDWVGADNIRETSGVLELYVAANKAWLPLERGEWIALDSEGFYPIKPQVFGNRWTDDDMTSVQFNIRMVDGDQASVTVDGFGKAATAVRALIHCGSPEVVMNLIKKYADQGDMSVVTLATELGSLAEKRVGSTR